MWVVHVAQVSSAADDASGLSVARGTSGVCEMCLARVSEWTR